MPKIFLGSSSISRRAILEEHLTEPDDEIIINSSDAPEVRDAAALGGPKELVLENTRRKCEGCLEKLRSQNVVYDVGDILICGDCVVVSKSGEVYNKPSSEAEALRYLDQYDTDKYLSVVQAVSVTRLTDLKTFTGTEECKCVLYGLPKEGREEFLKNSGAMGAAGGIIIEDPFVSPYVVSFEGGTKESVMGLSVQLTQQLIRQARAN